jgi:hypothetical protein
MWMFKKMKGKLISGCGVTSFSATNEQGYWWLVDTSNIGILQQNIRIISTFCLQPPHPHQTERRPESATVSATARQLARQHYRPHTSSRERYLRASLTRWRAGLPSYRLRETRNNLQRHSWLAVPGWVQGGRTQLLDHYKATTIYPRGKAIGTWNCDHSFPSNVDILCND